MEARHAPDTPARWSSEEWQTRVDLAACYRLVAHFGMDDSIYTHISARVPGRHDHFLLNPLGLRFEEITASSLVKIDMDGALVEPTEHEVNAAGFTIHSAVHAARPDVFCVLHTHTEPGIAISCLKEGLLPLNQWSLQFHNRIAYHDYEGIALDLDERERLVADLGPLKVMVLRNHGLLTAGFSIGEAFILMYNLNRSCVTQLAAQATGAELVIPSAAVCEKVAQQYEGSHESVQRRQAFEKNEMTGEQREWAAYMRLLDRINPGYEA